MPVSRPIACTTGLLLGAVAGPAGAWQLDYSLQAAVGYSDNINESATDPIGQALVIPRVNFTAREEGDTLLVHAAGQVEYRDYVQGDFSNELRGQLSGVATWIIFPKRLSFDFEDYAAAEPVNTLAPNAPGNIQQTNVFTLGPTFNFRLQPTLNGQAEVRFSNTTASQTKDFNSNRVLGAVRAVKNLNPTDVLSANVEAQDVHFTDSSGGPDYRRYDAFARYQSKLSQLDVDVAAGYTRVNFSSQPGFAGDTHSGLLARGTLTWRATPSNTLAFGWLRQYSDASQDLVVDPLALAGLVTGTGLIVGSTPITSQVYLEHRVSLNWAYQNERLKVNAQPYYRKLDYVVDSSFDQNAYGVVAGFSYRLRPLWTLAFDATEETRSYRVIDRRDNDWHLDLSLTDRMTRNWSVRFDLIRNQRQSDAVDQGFHENIAFVTVIYTR